MLAESYYELRELCQMPLSKLSAYFIAESLTLNMFYSKTRFLQSITALTRHFLSKSMIILDNALIYNKTNLTLEIFS